MVAGGEYRQRTAVWRHAGPNEVASNVDEFKDVARTGGENRRSPTGGSAYGVLRYTTEDQPSRTVENEMERHTSKKLCLANSQPRNDSITQRHLRSSAYAENIREHHRQTSEFERVRCRYHYCVEPSIVPLAIYQARPPFECTEKSRYPW